VKVPSSSWMEGPRTGQETHKMCLENLIVSESKGELDSEVELSVWQRGTGASIRASNG
jgi:hypothetical protein